VGGAGTSFARRLTKKGELVFRENETGTEKSQNPDGGKKKLGQKSKGMGRKI